jgi:hypothetical protein
MLFYYVLSTTPVNFVSIGRKTASQFKKTFYNLHRSTLSWFCYRAMQQDESWSHFSLLGLRPSSSIAQQLHGSGGIARGTKLVVFKKDILSR